MKKAVLFGAVGILVCAFLVVVGTYYQEAAADEGRNESTLKKEVEILKKKNHPSQATCPCFYYFDGPGYDNLEDCERYGSQNCADQWDPYGTGNPKYWCTSNGCVQAECEECDSASTADYLGVCYWRDGAYHAECRCHCWEDVK